METESGNKPYLGSKVGPSMLGKLLRKCWQLSYQSLYIMYICCLLCVCVCMHEYVSAIVLRSDAEFRLVNCKLTQN